MASPRRSRTNDSPPTGLLEAQLTRFGLSRTEPPGAEDWGRLLEGLEEACSVLGESDGVENLLQRQVDQRRTSQTMLVEQSPIPIMQVDLSAVEVQSSGLDRPVDLVRINAANRAAAALFGLDGVQGSQTLGVDSLGLSSDARKALYDMVRSKCTSVEIEFEGRRADGEPYEAILLAAVPVPFGIPDFTRVVLSMTDITDHKVEERRMQELVASKNRMLASVTTELRSPLAQVIDFARLLEDATEEPERRRDLAHAIAGGAARVASVVEDLLVAARAELGDLILAQVPVNLSAQVAQVLELGGTEMSAVTTPGRNVEPRICIGDPARVRQIVRNLLGATLENGGVDIAIQIHRRASTMHLTISSTGGALPDALSERVFEQSADFLGDPATPDARFVGMSVAKQLAVGMGGDLRYRHESGRTEFEITLPAARSS